MNGQTLTSCPLFIGLQADAIDDLMDRSVTETLRIAKGNYLVRQGDPVNALYLLSSGVVRTEMITKEGNLLEIDFIDAPHPLAPAFIFASHSKFPVDVIAMNECTLHLIPKNAWLKEMMSDERLLANFLRINANMTVFLSNKIQMMSIKSIKGKLALFILENTTAEKPFFLLKRNRTQLSEYFGVQRPSLARTFGEMKEEGIIALDKKELTVLNREKLERLI